MEWSRSKGQEEAAKSEPGQEVKVKNKWSTAVENDYTESVGVTIP